MYRTPSPPAPSPPAPPSMWDTLTQKRRFVLVLGVNLFTFLLVGDLLNRVGIVLLTTPSPFFLVMGMLASGVVAEISRLRHDHRHSLRGFSGAPQEVPAYLPYTLFALLFDVCYLGFLVWRGWR